MDDPGQQGAGDLGAERLDVVPQPGRPAPAGAPPSIRPPERQACGRFMTARRVSGRLADPLVDTAPSDGALNDERASRDLGCAPPTTRDAQRCKQVDSRGRPRRLGFTPWPRRSASLRSLEDAADARTARPSTSSVHAAAQLPVVAYCRSRTDCASSAGQDLDAYIARHTDTDGDARRARYSLLYQVEAVERRSTTRWDMTRSRHGSPRSRQRATARRAPRRSTWTPAVRGSRTAHSTARRTRRHA